MEDILHAIGFILSFGILFTFIIVLEAYYWHKKGKTDIYNYRETVTNLVMGAGYKITDGVLIAVVMTGLYNFVYELGFQYVPDDGVWSILFIFLVADFVFYWQHRGQHKIRWFWTAHAVHHSSTRMNFSTALRQSPLYNLNAAWLMWWIPIALVGFDKTWALIAIELNLAYQFFIHTEMVDRLGFLEKFLNTPSHHRVHHGNQSKQIDTNFAGTLIIWDKIFGTFVDESEAGLREYGLTTRQPKTLNPLRLWTDELFFLIKDLFRYKNLRILWKAPDWAEKNID